MAASLSYLNKFKACLCWLLPKKLSEEKIRETGELVEILEKQQENIISLHAV